MIHFGAICPPVSSHLAVMLSVSKELQKRGHRVTFFNIADAESRVRAEGFDFRVVGRETEPLGSLDEFLKTMGRLTGLQSMRFQLKAGVRITKILLNEVPESIRSCGIGALLVDQGDPSGSTIAEHCKIPFITICSAAPLNRDPDVPPTVMPWSYNPSVHRRWRNRTCFAVMDLLVSPITRAINEVRADWGLQPLKGLTETFSPCAQVSQLTADFDFPNRFLPANFHYIGLFDKDTS